MISQTSNTPVVPTARKNAGDLMVEAGRITPEQLADASMSRGNRKLTDVLVEQGLVTPEEIATALSLHLNIPVIDLKRHAIQSDAVRLIPEQTARRHNLVPLDVVADALVVVMEDPTDVGVIEDLGAQAKVRIQPALGIPSQILEAIDLNYRVSDEIENQVRDFTVPMENLRQFEVETSGHQVAQSPIVRTLDMILAQAVQDRASDVHLEPQEIMVRVRFRIDGILRDAISLPPSVLEPLVSRVKILAEMNITEHRRPQDGQFTISVGERKVHIRAATVETVYGESVVLRILDDSVSQLSLAELGFLPDALNMYQEMLKIPFGMILVAGPTGSGKTTTQYASIKELDRNERNIMTIEDPIEYRFTDIRQIQVNEKAGMTFATGLRAIMRLDPDIILLGEIRDSETAQTAVQAALTGHLVLSCIHANDAASVSIRLINLGVEPALISSVLVGIVAQRMVRRVCLHCRTEYQPSMEELAAFADGTGEEREKFFHGSGCNFCSRTGFLGRIGIFELIAPSERFRKKILAGADLSDLKAQAISDGMVTLWQDSMLKVEAGNTTIQEVLRNVFSIA